MHAQQAEAANLLEKHMRDTHGLPPQASQAYARALAAGGCDSISAFEVLSPNQLKADYGLKPGHIKKVAKSRTRQNLATWHRSTVAQPEPEPSPQLELNSERRRSREAFNELPDCPDDLFDSEFYMDMLDPYSTKFAFAMSAKTIIAAKRWRRRSANVIMSGRLEDSVGMRSDKPAEFAPARGSTPTKLEVVGYHGCPFFSVAASVALALLKRGSVNRVVIRRAGQLHVPTWYAEGNREPFKRYVQDLPRTAKWNGSSPRVICDDDPETAIGGADITMKFARELEGETYGAPTVAWEEGSSSTSISIIKFAFNQDAQTIAKMFAGDPPGPARVCADDQILPGLHWGDLAEEGDVYCQFALNDSPFVQISMTPEEYASVAAGASASAKAAAAAIIASLPGVRTFPVPVQDWFKCCLARGPEGVSELITGTVRSGHTPQTAGQTNEFKTQVIACLEVSDYREQVAKIYADVQLNETPTPQVALVDPPNFAQSSDDEADAEAAELMAAIES